MVRIKSLAQKNYSKQSSSFFFLSLASTNSPHLTKSSKVTTDLKNSNLPKSKGLNSKKSVPYIAENRNIQGETKTTTLFKGVITPTATGGASAIFTETEELVHRPMGGYGGYDSQEEEIAPAKPKTRASSRQKKVSTGSSRWGNENEAMDVANFAPFEPAQPTKRQPRQSARSKPY